MTRPTASANGQRIVHKPSFWRSMRTVAWGLLGVRKNSEYQDDLARANPLHLIIAALLGVLVFIGVLLFAVRWAVATA
ncbi:MAG: DUF2970 domain-containing protein [Ottowia sp.]|uniref:DUF2970 domain-containing protein n=1 Tax=unclassified Ottowia TaxID=2645081 RepID=UPI003C2DD750